MPLTVTPSGEFVGTLTPTINGTWTLRADVALKTGGLKKTSEAAELQVSDLNLALGPNQTPMDLGEIKAGTSSSPQTVDLSASELGGPYTLTASTEMTGFSVKPSSFEITPAQKTAAVTFDVDADHVGGAVSGTLSVGVGKSRVSIPVTATVVPLTFWERHGKLILAILSALGLLGLLLFIARGIFGPHNFAPDARINWGDTVERLNKNSLVMREIRGSGSGFYKNAKLIFGGPTSFAPADGTPLLVIEAVGPNRMEIRSEGGADLLSVNKFDHTKTKKVEGNASPLSTGEIYQVGRFYVRVR
ncbi:MAG: hypothetical protein R3E66_07380 [bacterium]